MTIEMRLLGELDWLDELAADDEPYDRGIRCATGHLRDWLRAQPEAAGAVDPQACSTGNPSPREVQS